MWKPDDYLVKPGAKIRLKDRPTRDDGGLTKEEGAAEFEKLHERLIELDELLYADARHAVLLVFQGMDTSGKDSTVRAVFSGVNPSGNDVASFKQPSSLELSHDFLWRIHSRVPARGSMTIFNRSHYEDVLVVRVNRLAPEARWKTRFEHINNFERLLHDEGTTIRKFYLHISPEFQKERLEKRLADPEKHWKFDATDLTVRKQWKEYAEAYEDMLRKCSTEYAPWYIVPAERRWFRDLLVARVLVETLESLDLRFPSATVDSSKIEIDDVQPGKRGAHESAILPDMIAQLGAVAERIFRKTCPDPFVIAILLAIVTAGLALAFGDWPSKPAEQARAVALLETWRAESGVWKFLSFSMQMCLVLVTGHALAAAPPVRRLIVRLAGVPRSPGQAVALVAAAACVSGVINWGLSLIVGALLAREVGRAAERRGLRVHYPLLAATGFLGLLVWHGGLSGSAPLLMSSRANAEKVLPATYLERLGPQGIPLSQTLFSPLNLTVTGGLLLAVPLLAALLHPRRPEAIWTIALYAPPDDARRDPQSDSITSPQTPVIEAGGGISPTTSGSIPDWLDRSWIIAVLIALPFLAVVARTVWMEGLKLAGADAAPLTLMLSGLNRFGLNEVNASMLAIGLLLHASPRAYMAAAEDGARGCGGIIIQFPIYAGVVAIVEASGLTAKIASGFAAAGNAQTIPLLTFLAAGVINFFIPSGGAQWGVQGPIAMRTASEAGIDDVGKMVMSVAYGDQTTNMLQPFWALPLICITGVPAREIVGYTAVLMVFAGFWMAIGLVLF